MLLKHVKPLPGGLVDYDYQTMPYAKAAIKELKELPNYCWWWRGNKPLKEIGWTSFVCRNIEHPLAVELLQEFKRVYGRDAELGD